MKDRIFNVLYSICGVWIAVLIWNWFGLIPVLTAPIVLFLGAAPIALVLAIRYLAG